MTMGWQMTRSEYIEGTAVHAGLGNIGVQGRYVPVD